MRLNATDMLYCRVPGGTIITRSHERDGVRCFRTVAIDDSDGDDAAGVEEWFTYTVEDARARHVRVTDRFEDGIFMETHGPPCAVDAEDPHSHCGATDCPRCIRDVYGWTGRVRNIMEPHAASPADSSENAMPF